MHVPMVGLCAVLVSTATALGGAIDDVVADPPRMALFKSAPSSQGRLLALDRDALADLFFAGDRVVIEGLPLHADRQVDLELERFSVTGPETRFVVGSRGGADRAVDFDPGQLILLRGRVAGAPGSHVYLAVGERGALGSVDLGSGGPSYLLTGADRQQRGLAGGLLEVVEISGFGAPGPGAICGVGTQELSMLPPPRVGAGLPPSTRVIELAIETDHEYFELFGDLDAAADYVTALYGAVTDLYLRDVNARFELTFVRLWDQPEDLFNEDDPLVPFRDYWNQNMTEVNRDLAQLLTGRRNLPYGGVAWLSAVCGQLGYSVSGYTLGSFADPVLPAAGNWDIIVAAHELGHNCGTFHTHDYGIDGCAFGDVQRGTVMSYCHTVSGGVSNIDMRFHTEVQSIIEFFLAEQECLILDCNGNGIADPFEFGTGISEDLNGNGIPDACEDCNQNGTLDDADLAEGSSNDVNFNGIPDECETDCNDNGVPDELDIGLGTSEDLYGNGVPDECETDCNDNGTADINEIQADMSLDVDRNAILDACQDCDGDGTTDLEAVGGGLNVWVASDQSTAVTEFHAASGAPVKTILAFIDQVQDLVFGPDGLIYVSSAGTDQVVRFDPDSGAFLGQFVNVGASGLAAPAGLLFTGDGDLLVASRGSDSVLAYDGTTGDFIEARVDAGSGGLLEPFGLAIAPDGRLLVTTGDNRVLQFDQSTGDPLGELVVTGAGGLDQPRSLLPLPDGRLLVASFGSNAVLAYDGASGQFIDRFDRGGNPFGFWFLEEPWGLRCSPRGDVVHVSSHAGNAAVHSYDLETGLFLRTYYILAQDIAGPTGFDIRPASVNDCNLNLLPDQCDLAAGRSSDDDGNGIPDECDGPPTCPGDVTGDGAVDVADLVAVIVDWGLPGGPADVNDDGIVDVGDLVGVITQWGCG